MLIPEAVLFKIRVEVFFFQELSTFSHPTRCSGKCAEKLEPEPVCGVRRPPSHCTGRWAEESASERILSDVTQQGLLNPTKCTAVKGQLQIFVWMRV